MFIRIVSSKSATRIIRGHGVIEENAGVVYQDIELFECPDREIDALFRRVFFRDIGAERERFAAMMRGSLSPRPRPDRPGNPHNQRAPSRANLWAFASPMPVPPPVTIATFPSRRRLFFPDLRRRKILSP